MNVREGNLALVFGPENEAGQVVRVLWPYDVKEYVGQRWVVRIWDEGECVIPDRSLMALDVNPCSDPAARELLDDAGQAAWDRWFAPPNIDF